MVGYRHKYGEIQVREWFAGNTCLQEAAGSAYVRNYPEEPLASVPLEEARKIAERLLNR